MIIVRWLSHSLFLIFYCVKVGVFFYDFLFSLMTEWECNYCTRKVCLSTDVFTVCYSDSRLVEDIMNDTHKFHNKLSDFNLEFDRAQRKFK